MVTWSTSIWTQIIPTLVEEDIDCNNTNFTIWSSIANGNMANKHKNTNNDYLKTKTNWTKKYIIGKDAIVLTKDLEKHTNKRYSICVIDINPSLPVFNYHWMRNSKKD